MADRFAFDIIAAFYCSTCDCVREVSTTVDVPVAEPLGSQLFALSSQQERKCPVCSSDISPAAQQAIRPAGDVETWPSELPWRWNRSDMPRKPPRQTAKELLSGLTSGTADTYETYRSLYQIWRLHNSSVQELRPLFSIPGVELDGRLSVTEDFKKQVLSSATAILANLQD
jgi:hypothetical protein